MLLVVGAFIGYRVHKNGGGLKGLLATAVGHDENTVKNLPKIYCLVLGKSQNLTDTIMVVAYDPQEQQASVLSIPRDTFIGNNKSKATAWDKLNAVYQTGAENVLKEVNELTGLDIQYYLMVDNEAFRVLVDAVGGVKFNVPMDMDYDTNKQNFHIHLKAGEQVLDGEKAEQLVRFRHNNNGSTYSYDYGIEDLGRTKTQRAFLTALIKQTLKPENLLKINEFIEIANQYVKTNLDFNTVKDYIPYLTEFNMSDLKTEYLPGEAELTNGVWIYSAYEKQTKELIDKLFLHPSVEGETISGENLNPNISRETIKVEVLNGTTSNSKLEKVVAKLQNAGYHVTKTGNTSSTEQTTIINRGNVGEEVQEELKTLLSTTHISAGQATTVDITIIIGKDI
ncbi:MAG: LCP family protein [Clostridia bacterium]|nr:LCP family protein [Clostridia bacterium]